MFCRFLCTSFFFLSSLISFLLKWAEDRFLVWPNVFVLACLVSQTVCHTTVFHFYVSAMRSRNVQFVLCLLGWLTGTVVYLDPLAVFCLFSFFAFLLLFALSLLPSSFSVVRDFIHYCIMLSYHAHIPSTIICHCHCHVHYLLSFDRPENTKTDSKNNTRSCNDRQGIERKRVKERHSNCECCYWCGCVCFCCFVSVFHLSINLIYA